MSQHNHATVYADVIQHFNEASSYATKYQQASRRFPVLQRTKKYFLDNVAQLLNMHALDKTVLVLMAPLHFGTAIFEAMQLSPILQGIVFGTGAHSDVNQQWLSILTVCTLFASSLLAGFCFFKISIKKDAIVPGKRRISPGWLIGGIVLGLLYVGSIGWVILQTTNVNESFNVFYFLVLVAAIEVALSAAAVVGYTLIFQYTQVKLLEYQCNSTEKAMYRYTEKCALAFRYYRIALTLYNHQQNLNMPCVDTPAIAEAISFHEGFYRPCVDQ